MRSRTLATLLVISALLAGLPATSAAAGTSYQDVDSENLHAPAIEALAAVAILFDTDCADGTFCPDEAVSRWVAAVWLGRTVYGTHFEPTDSRFEDLSETPSWAAPYINLVTRQGLMEECQEEPLGFCPHDSVTRSEMATILTRAFQLQQASAVGFGDLEEVDNPGDINALAAAGITVGCSAHSLLFCPSEVTTRGEMATLLGRATGLVPLPGYQPATDPTPLPIDPAVRFGTLDNGYTYYLRQNDQPGNSVTLRLVVKAGAVHEPEPGLGMAHFLEHMLFRGTEAYTGEELSATLRSLGAEFGPDFNAGVWYDQTVYDLTVTTDPVENVSTAMHVLSQMGHAALIDPEAVDSERGVVLDEARYRTATASGQISAAFDRVYTQGTPYEGYYPIGTVSGVESTTAEDLREFYETWYVPSNMAIVAVGDMPTDDLYALVEQHFGHIEPGEAPEFSLGDITPDRAGAYHVVTDNEQGYSFISLDIPIPTFDYGVVGGDRRLLLEGLITTMVQNRLTDAFYRGELTQVDVPQFVTFNHNLGLRYYGTNWQGENLDSASRDYVSVLQTVRRFGFNDDDLTRAVKAFATALEHQLDSAPSTQDVSYAESYVSHFLVGVDISEPQERHDRLMALMDEVTAEELTDHFRWLMNQAGPIVIAVGPDATRVPTPDALRLAVGSAMARSEPPPIEPEIEKLIDAPQPVAPVATRTVTALEATEWEFANGARVAFLYSDIAEATVNIRARSLGGWSTLYPGARALAPRAVEAVFGSGWGELTSLQMRRFLGGSTASLSAVIGTNQEGFSGAANPEDLETLFQLLHLAVTGPRVDDLAYGQAFNSAAIRTSLAEVRPDWQAFVAYHETRFGADWYRPVATREQLATLTPEVLLSLYSERLGDVDDMVLAVVGDTTAEEVERLARHYIGTLPAGDRDTFVDRRQSAPSELVRRVIPITPDMTAWLAMYNEAPIAISEVPSARLNARILQSILDDRLFRLVREELGASYVAGASIQTDLAPQPGVYSQLFYSVDPARYDDAYRQVLSVLEDMVANGPTDEELDQAKTVVRADLSDVSNGDLLNALTNRLYLADNQLPTPQGSLEQLESVTRSSVMAMAAALYDQDGRVEIVRRPTAYPNGSE